MIDGFGHQIAATLARQMDEQLLTFLGSQSIFPSDYVRRVMLQAFADGNQIVLIDDKPALRLGPLNIRHEIDDDGTHRYIVDREVEYL